MPGGNAYSFSSPGDIPLGLGRQAAWDEILAARIEMREGLDAILARLRADYLKVDIAKTNRKAHHAYLDDHLERERRRKEAAKKRTKRT